MSGFEETKATSAATPPEAPSSAHPPPVLLPHQIQRAKLSGLRTMSTPNLLPKKHEAENTGTSSLIRRESKTTETILSSPRRLERGPSDEQEDFEEAIAVAENVKLYVFHQSDAMSSGVWRGLGIGRVSVLRRTDLSKFRIFMYGQAKNVLCNAALVSGSETMHTTTNCVPS